jgi:hypothetical protein
MTTLFFLFGIFVIMNELQIFINPGFRLKMLNNLKQKDFFKSDEFSKEDKSLGCIYAFFNIFYFIWGAIGLFASYQWKLFLVFFVIGIVTMLASKAFEKFGIYGSKIHLFTLRIDAIICIITTVEISFVHFHGFSIINYLLVI